ncbi:hypothetical protein [Streptomyces sparsogenes]|uniref:hypothetical protein n=1 Tax=Streptomyces sparsogenes TaxID=67365 RepID=UPI000978DC96|nr:hypothetical protein [Streptomyces sparsogenes]
MDDYFSTSAKAESTNCLQCGAPLEQKKGAGRAKRFCRPWHGKLYRRNATMIYGGEVFEAYPARRSA